MTESISVRHILAPVDLGDGSKSALQYVRFLARTAGARVTLFYAPATEDEALLDEADLRFHEAAVRRFADSFFEDLPYDVIVAAADPAVAVPRTAREIGADLIIMGTLGRKGIERAIAGAFIGASGTPDARAVC
jgi:nucleotide-binding universal stress UspA family protein